MQHPFSLPALVLPVWLLIPAHLPAQTIVHGSDVQVIASIASGFGSASVETDMFGDPLITGRMDGLRYSVIFYGCTDGADCTSIQFRAQWSLEDPITLEQINAWNRDYRFGKAYLDDDGALTLEWDVNLDGGITHHNLDDNFDWWRVVMLSLIDHLP